MFDKAKCAKHVTIINLNTTFVQLRSETKAFQQNDKSEESQLYLKFIFMCIGAV